MKRFLLTTAFPDLRRTNGANRAVASKHTIGAAAPGGALLLRRRNMRRWGKVVLAAAAATALAMPVAAKTKRKVVRVQHHPAAAMSPSGRTCGFGFWEAGQTCVSRSGRVCTITGSTHSKLRCN